MAMLDLLEKELTKLNVFEGNIPQIVYDIANAIPSQSIPYRMKLALAISEIMLYVSQFRINIKHWNDSIIPINAITFCIAKSGAAKDSSLKAVRKCFNESYDLINKYRIERAVNEAIAQAQALEIKNAEDFKVYKDFYIEPNPLFAAISTPEGFIQHLNDLDSSGIGAGYMYSGEFSKELSSNINLSDCLKIISELYDCGDKEVKIIKTRETQSKEIKGLPVSALFISSQDEIIFDDAVKKKFRLEFTSKLARRSFFVYANEDIISEEYNSIDDMIKHEKYLEDQAKESRYKVIDIINDITSNLLEIDAGTTLDVKPKVIDIFTLYKKYNEEIANTIDNQYPIAKLTRCHLQWKALKLSGALALMDYSLSITPKHYIAAIEFCELINEDITIFEKELNKETYEVFTDYCKKYANNGEYELSLHAIRKLGLMPYKGLSSTMLSELVKLCNSYDTNGMYSMKNDIIYYKEITKTDNILLSYVECKGTKEYRGKHCVTGFICEELTFSDLSNMLEGDYAYSPFKFLNGIRGKENIISGCKWIVLDIDSSEITDEEAHLMLSDINHYIVRTSNKDNEKKYRVLLELDAEINITDIQWTAFIKAVCNDLGLIADALPKSQIFFSYSDRNILSVLDGSKLETKNYLSLISNIEAKPKPNYTTKVCNQMLDNPMSTFERAYNAEDGSGRRLLIWACRYARELGANRQYCKDLLVKITDYWVKGFPTKDLEAMFRQLDRWYFEE